MFQIAHRHLFWFTGLTCDELAVSQGAANQSAFKVQNRQHKDKKKKQAHFMTLRLRPE